MLDDNRWISMPLEHIDGFICTKLCRFPSPELTRQNLTFLYIICKKICETNKILKEKQINSHPK